MTYTPLRDVTACSMRATCSHVRGRVGGDSKPRPKQCPITSLDQPGPLVFQRATLKNWVGPGYEAMTDDGKLLGHSVQ